MSSYRAGVLRNVLSDVQFRLLTELYDSRDVRDDMFNGRQRRTLDLLRKYGLANTSRDGSGRTWWYLTHNGVERWEAEDKRRRNRVASTPIQET